jgi:myo-inositol-1(or 4)-monophosphatase
VAAGRFDAYWEHDLSPWDIAAGLILVREAGGYATDLAGGEMPHVSGEVIAGNETIQRALMRVLKDAATAA